MRVCTSCGDRHAYEVVADGDLERTYDFKAEWQGLRLLCPACGALQRVSFDTVALADLPVPGRPDLRIRAVAGRGLVVKALGPSPPS
jgi:hypothetical protein